MFEKTAYLEKFKELHHSKTGVRLSDDAALNYFERLVSLVDAITGHVDLHKIIIKKHGRSK